MTVQSVPSLALQPGDLSDQELARQWRLSLAPFFDAMPLTPPDAPAVTPRSRQFHLGEFLLIESQFSRQRFLRDAEWGRRHDDTDHILLQAFVTGRNVVSNGDCSYVEDASSVFAVNLGYEVDAASTDAEVISLVLPRGWLAGVLPDLRDKRGALFPPGSMAARLMVDYMTSLRRQVTHAKRADVPVMTDGLVGLLSGLLRHEDPTARDANTGVMAAMRSFIREHLSDPNLGVEQLCRRFRMSRATVFRLFKPWGGVATYVQGQRLLACFGMLTAPAHLTRPIYDIALDCGLANPSYTALLFRRHFGMTPREVREAALAHLKSGTMVDLAPAQSGQAVSDVMQQWARSLGNATSSDPAPRDKTRTSSWASSAVPLFESPSVVGGGS